MSLKSLSVMLDCPAFSIAQTARSGSAEFAPTGTSAEVSRLIRFDDGSGEGLPALGPGRRTSPASK